MKMSRKRYKPGKVLHDFHEYQLKLGKNPTLEIDRSLIKAYVVNRGTTDLSAYNLIREKSTTRTNNYWSCISRII